MATTLLFFFFFILFLKQGFSFSCISLSLFFILIQVMITVENPASYPEAVYQQPNDLMSQMADIEV